MCAPGLARPERVRRRLRAVAAADRVLLHSSQSTPITYRDLACALVWCGYFAPEEAANTDARLAKNLFGVKREEFVRARQRALRSLAQLLEFSRLPSGGGS